MRIEQVIRNLVSNATKYGGNENILIDIIKNENSLHFSITDAGVGVPEDELKSIFEIFSQSSRTKNKAGGSGIGLSICKTIINDHGGEIGASNNAHDSGTNFWFNIPIVTKDENGQTLDPKKPKTVVLVVDDEESVLGVTSIVLNSLGFEVITANCGVDGLNALKLHHKKIDVVLLDVMMPDIYGIDLLKTIKEDANLKSIPILMYSGISDEKEMQKAIDLGAEGCIDKTSSKEEILRMLIKYTL
jgi:two-component system sensor histidine kinase ChiS